VAAYVRQHHIGLLALFVALGGTAYAASLPKHSVGTRELKNNAVTGGKVKDGQIAGSDVRDNSLTRKDILLAQLGKVPLAVTADNAKHANDAATVGGARVLAFNARRENGTAATEFLNAGGLSLRMTCPPGVAYPQIAANTTKDASSIFAYGTYLGVNPAVESNYDEDGSFGTEDTFDVDEAINSDDNTPNLAHLVYEGPDGSVVTVTLMVDWGSPTAAVDCIVAGTAIAS
jgi:hypothetical protein